MGSWHTQLACPACRNGLELRDEDAYCEQCHTAYPWRDDVFHFLGHPFTPQSADADAMIHSYRHPNRLIKVLRRIISTEYFPGKGWRNIKASLFQPGQRCLIIGSGVTRYEHAIHLDLDDFPGVDVVADAHHLPFVDNSVDAVLCEVVLEHVRDAQQVIAESLRVLRPGGRCLFIAPFLFPFHGHPDDFRRWSKQGLAAEFAAFQQVETGIHAGPCSAMANLVTEWAYVLSGLRFPTGYTFVKGLFTTLLFPIKFLDALVIRFPEAHRMASTLYVTAVKPAAKA